MSQPTTPARSIALSAFSTPSTTHNGTPPQELTPRSKIRAMLAAIDDESDTDSHAGHRDREPRREALATIAGNAQKAQKQKIIDYKSTGEVDEANSDEEPIVPRGRLAARLQGRASKCPNSSPDHASEAKGNAYARIKEQLLQKRPKRDHEINSDFEAGLSHSNNDTSKDSPTETRRSPSSPQIPGPSQKNTPIRSRGPSPGLFLSPRSASGPREISQRTASNDSSDSDLPANPQTNSRFLELVARKRAERESRQAEEDKKRAERFAKQRSFQQQLSRDASSASGLSDEDRIVESKLTQQARPTRKASKKALEEMNRETQRMSRNMQLAHQAKTKKKITKDSLFARFNFRTSASPIVETPQNASSSTVASSRPASDVEDAVNEESPPTSPIRPDDPSMGAVDSDPYKGSTVLDCGISRIEQEEDDLPSMVDILSQPMQKTDKAKGKAREQINPNAPLQIRESKRTFTQPPIRMHPPKPSMASINPDSDSDLEIMPTRRTKKARTDVFDRLPAAKVQDARSLQTLRALARLNSPEKQAHGKKATISLAEMQSLLQGRARQQATEERAEKIAKLKSRGIIVQTAEERQKDQAEVEDLLEKARREGEELKQQEKRAAKKEKIANGEVDGLPDTSDEDEDYREDEEPDVELSGSEDEQQIIDDWEESASDAEESQNEEEEEGGEGLLDRKELEQHGLIDNEASEDGDNEGEAEEDDNGMIDDDVDENNESPRMPLHRPRRSRLVVGDDEDEDEDETTRMHSPSQDLQFPGEVHMFPPGLGSTKLDCEPMGMTQAFAATMADTQTQAEATDEEQDSMAFLGPPPEPNFPMFDVHDSPQVIEDSQNGAPQPSGNNDQNTGLQEIRLDFSQSQIQYGALGDTQDPAMTTQVSEMPDPTPDVGFTLSSPAPERFVNVPQSTADTVLLTPVKKPRRRLQRRLAAREESLDVEEVPSSPAHAGIDVPANAFDVMKKARKDTSAAEMFDKKKSEAKTMVEEQAQESEDEYAGLGGASDDESGGEEDDYVKEIIDQGEVNVDERQLAALYADKERASDEKAVQKLFKDINSGMLRRKRGAEFDLSDSEDDAEARQRRKRREFAKMRKALLENENVGKIAEDPKKVAFLRAIEDREDDEDLDFLDRPAEDSFRIEPDTQEVPDSQSQQQPSLPEPSLGKRKRSLQDSIPDKANMRPPAAARRTAAPKKPATLAEIRESVSFLIEDPGSINTVPDPSSSASEDENEHHHSNPRRRRPNPNTNPVIDRLSLKRAESASLSSTSRLAFHDPSSSISSGFKIPSLLRRATTSQILNGADANGISTNNSTAMTERAAGGREKGEFVRRGGTKRCSVNFWGREREKRGVVEGVERRRWESREREARRVRGSGGLGGLGVGGFE